MRYGEKYFNQSLIITTGAVLLLGIQCVQANSDSLHLLTPNQLDSVTAGVAFGTSSANASSSDPLFSASTANTSTSALFISNGGNAVGGAGAAAGAAGDNQSTSAATGVSPTPYGVSLGSTLSSSVGGLEVGVSNSVSSGVYFTAP